jgi:type I restriction enzyme, S subunit
VFNSQEAQQWESKQLGQIALLIQNGIYKSAENYGQGHPFLRMYNIQSGSWNLKLEPLAQVLLDEQELEKYKLHVGDLLISRVNSFELVGKCALVSSESEGYVFENMLIRLRISDSVDSMFVVQQINSRTVREQIEKVAKRAIGQASINSEDLRRIKIVLPPLTEQKHIAATLTETIAKAEQLRKTIEKQLEAINQLPAAFLRQAFNGEL